MRHLVTAALVLVGIIHLFPLAGVLGAGSLHALYGIEFSDPNALILMRHRAVLFGLLGGFLVVAGFVRALQFSALVLAAVSVVSFLVLAFMAGGFNASIAKVVAADWVALALVVAGAVAYALRARQRAG